MYVCMYVCMYTHLESRDLPNYMVSADVIGFGVLYSPFYPVDPPK